MKTCRGCPHIALDQWPQGKQAVRCLYTGNGDRFGRVLHIVRDGNPHPDSVRTPEWCRKERDGDDNPSVSPTASQLPLHKGASDTLYNSRARARIFADLLKGYL